jgi:hypothetical protein
MRAIVGGIVWRDFVWCDNPAGQSYGSPEPPPPPSRASSMHRYKRFILFPAVDSWQNRRIRANAKA